MSKLKGKNEKRNIMDIVNEKRIGMAILMRQNRL